MSKKNVPVPTAEEIQAFEDEVKADEKRMLAELEKGGNPAPDGVQVEKPEAPSIKQPGRVTILTMKKEVVDMALDLLIRLNGQPIEHEVTLVQGNIKLSAMADGDGAIHFCWEGIAEVG